MYLLIGIKVIYDKSNNKIHIAVFNDQNCLYFYYKGDTLVKEWKIEEHRDIHLIPKYRLSITVINDNLYSDHFKIEGNSYYIDDKFFRKSPRMKDSRPLWILEQSIDLFDSLDRDKMDIAGDIETGRQIYYVRVVK